MALLWITHSTSLLNCWAACAEKQQTPAFTSGSSMVMAGSDPLSRQPFSRRTRQGPHAGTGDANQVGPLCLAVLKD